MSFDWIDFFDIATKVGGFAGLILAIFTFTIFLLSRRLPLQKLRSKQVQSILKTAIVASSAICCLSLFLHYYTIPAESSQVVQDSLPTVQERKICIEGVRDAIMQKRVASDYGLSIVPCDKGIHRIEITFSGQLRQTLGANSVYNGGTVVILRDSIICAKFDNWTMPTWEGYDGNPTWLLEQELRDSISGLVKSNSDLVYDSICACIGGIQW